MTIQQFQNKFNGCQMSQAGESVTGQNEVGSGNGIVLYQIDKTKVDKTKVNKIKCVYWIERKANDGFLAVFSVDKIWEQEWDKFDKKYSAGQNKGTIPEEFSCYLRGQKNGRIGFTQHCDEIVLSDAGQATDVYCIERKESQPRNQGRRSVVKQLQGGADCVFRNMNSGGNIRFWPVLVAKPREKLTIFPANKFFVKFDETEYAIEYLEEGEKLPDIEDGI